MTPRAILWLKSLCAVLLGFGLYYSLMPHLPPPARHQPLELDLGVIVAGWFCLCMYGLIETGAALSRWLRRRN
jgi:hypothetical protein